MFRDTDLMEQCQYTMMEAPDAGQTWGSDLWTFDEVVRYANQRQQRFLKDTHLQIGIANIAASDGTAEYALPNDWISTVRVLWINEDGESKELTRSDSWEADNGIPNWGTVEGTPKIYIDSQVTPVQTLTLAPTPDEDGTIQIQYVPFGALLTGDGEIITLPDECVPTLKYGMLADMFSKVGRANDPTRAQYCMQRYQMGIEVTNMLLKGFKA